MTRDEQSALKEIRYILKHYQKEELDISISTIRTALGYIDKLQKDVELYKDQRDFVTNEYCNTIEELQKENEELKEEIKNQYKQYIKDHTEVIKNHYISKDKIRDKLAYLESALEGYYEAELEVNNTHETKILEKWKQWLEELLKEE